MNARYVFLDVETCPDQKAGAEEAARSRISAPSNYKDPEKIAAYVAEKGAEAYRRTSLDAGYGEVICIAYAFGNGDIKSLTRTMESGPDGERSLLGRFWAEVEENTDAALVWVGHKVAFFDLPFLYRRGAVLGVYPTRPIMPDYKEWSRDVMCTSYMWTGSSQNGIKLEELSEILGINSPKDLLHGSEVYDAALAGEYEAIANYCEGDVRATREIFNRLIAARG